VLHLLGQAHEGPAADHKVGALVIDLDSCGRPGLDVYAMVRERRWPVKVVVTWRAGDPDLRNATLRYGPYVLQRRPRAPAEWLALVRDIQGDGRSVSPAMLPAVRAACLMAVLLGLWLACSAFLWPHTAPQRWNALVAGALGAFTGWAVLVIGRVGLQTILALGGWLLLSPAFLPWRAPATLWNHGLVGSGLVALAWMTLLHLRGTRAAGGALSS
jgi:hypothetical protein